MNKQEGHQQKNENKARNFVSLAQEIPQCRGQLGGWPPRGKVEGC